MGIAFHQTEINIKIAKKHGKEISKLLLDKGWITEDMPVDAALAAIGWHGQSQRNMLEIDEIDVDKMTDRVRQHMQALAPFVRDGSLVRFESEESSKDYALCVFDNGQAHGYGWLGAPTKTAAAAAIGAVPHGPWNEYIHDESPSRQKLTDHRYWAVVALNLAKRIWFIASDTKSFGAKDWDQAKWIMRACEEARKGLMGERYLVFQDIQMYEQEVRETPPHLAKYEQEIKLRWLKGPRKKLAAWPLPMEADELQALLQYRETFAQGRGLLFDGQEGVFPAEVLAFFDHLRTAPWYRQISDLKKDSREFNELRFSFNGLTYEMLDSADLKETLVYLHLMTSVQDTAQAITPGVGGEKVEWRAPNIHQALARIGQLAAA